MTSLNRFPSIVSCCITCCQQERGQQFCQLRTLICTSAIALRIVHNPDTSLVATVTILDNDESNLCIFHFFRNHGRAALFRTKMVYIPKTMIIIGLLACNATLSALSKNNLLGWLPGMIIAFLTTQESNGNGIPSAYTRRYHIMRSLLNPFTTSHGASRAAARRQTGVLS